MILLKRRPGNGFKAYRHKKSRLRKSGKCAKSAQNRNRTCTLLPIPDFESDASTNSAIWASKRVAILCNYSQQLFLRRKTFLPILNNHRNMLQRQQFYCCACMRFRLVSRSWISALVNDDGDKIPSAMFLSLMIWPSVRTSRYLQRSR